LKKFYGKFIDVRSHEEYEEKYHAPKKNNDTDIV